MVRTHADAFTAVDTSLAFYDRLAVPHTDSLGRATLDTMRAAFAQIGMKRHRVLYSVHVVNIPFLGLSPGSEFTSRQPENS